MTESEVSGGAIVPIPYSRSEHFSENRVKDLIGRINSRLAAHIMAMNKINQVDLM